MHRILLIFTFVTLSLNLTLGQSKNQSSAQKPNIILVMVDDLGYSDFGAYGSEIQTPTIDKLAAEGLRLREFYNNSICAPTRASLITGQYHHKAGVGYFNVNLGLPAYQGWLNKESLTFGEVLKQAGYNTYLSGKWHVGNDSLYWPNQRGFDRFYGFIGGASNFYDISPYKDKVPPVELVENNRRINLEPGKYLTDEIMNHAISYINESKNKPFFLYLAYNAPHWPLQAPAEDIARYKESTMGPGLTLAAYQAQLKTDKLVLVDFGSRYCGSCKKLAPTVDEIEKEQAANVKVIRIEAYENKGLVKELGITALPTLVLYKGDQAVWKKTGVTPKGEIQSSIAESL
ncbi:sulfatase-like hydrolase/transferase [Larkinella terrae]|uniref:Sulfatase-like hydrolase/transferase n=1 Tax=Larkinella terrae TaxID=2025311 RepID=A0A7K0EGQ2_9BACT|nr:sulfatase-like hydrolase/transferase [Larkinella terrae]MRS60892.1 sulfatase-like hydrolase/transferase [Larkinella terrae]